MQLHQPGHGLTIITDENGDAAPHEDSGSWAPDVWELPVQSPNALAVVFARLDLPAIRGFAVLLGNGGFHVYGDRAANGSVAVYAVGHNAGPQAHLYQAAITVRDGVVQAEYDRVVGPLNQAAPQELQDAFAEFITAVNDARDTGSWPAQTPGS